DRRAQHLRNIDQASSLFATAESAVAEASNIALEAKGIASEMSSSIIDPETRKNHATIIDAMLTELQDLANTKFNEVHVFGGTRSSMPPIMGHLGGYNNFAERNELAFHVGIDAPLPLVLDADETFGMLSSRIEGDRDLNPRISPETRIADLDGVLGGGIDLGEIELELNGTERVRVDLSDADTVEDILTRLEQVITDCETEHGIIVLEPPGVGINAAGNGIALHTAAGCSIVVRDLGAGRTAEQLGLTNHTFIPSNPDGLDLNPKITPLTLLSNLPGVTPTSDFVIKNAGQQRVVEASSARTVQDLMNAVNKADIGARLEISPAGDRLNIVNQLSGGEMQVFETAEGTTAADLGIRSSTGSTRLENLNDGRGVHIVSGSTDPQSGLPDPSRDIDFRVHLSDGSSFDVDLAGAETLGDVVNIIQTAAPAGVTVGLDQTGGNGIVISDTLGGGNAISVEPLNRSMAATDLGIEGAGTGATLVGEDRATVAVDGIFSHLLALRDALLRDDQVGITFAGEALEGDIDRLAQSRAVLGQRGNRLEAIQRREEDRQLVDEQVRSELRDLDYGEASIRFTTLQTQLQAAMLTGVRASELNLLSFLG
ncbi:MAG: flagellin, partial [Planctomycetota bacterium]